MNIVITGGGKGIGLELTKRFLREPEHRVWVCSRDVDALTTLNHPRLNIAALDLTRSDEAEIYSSVSAQLSQVDILIHNAGVLVNRPFQETAIDDWRQVFEVNVFSAVKVSLALLPLLKKSAGAHIVHIGSMGGFQGASKFPGLSAYSASKAALANVTECMAEELKSDGIHVNCLALGAVDTAMLRQAFPGYQAPVGSESMADMIYQFSVTQRMFFNGKILPVSASTP